MKCFFFARYENFTFLSLKWRIRIFSLIHIPRYVLYRYRVDRFDKLINFEINDGKYSNTSYLQLWQCNKIYLNHTFQFFQNNLLVGLKIRFGSNILGLNIHNNLLQNLVNQIKKKYHIEYKSNTKFKIIG